jgi:GT2 family glycosyltransferase
MDNREMKNIAVVIPNLNGLNDLKCVFESISNQSYKNYKVILVDNGSLDDSVAFTKDSYPEHIVISLDRNYGFSAAVNKGIAFALESLKSDVILLLNNDIELTPDFFEEAIKTFIRVPDAGFIAVKMMNYFNRDKIDDTGDFIKAYGGSPFARGHSETDNGQYDKPEYIFGACAGAAFYKSELFVNAGMFDEDFFAYYEDIDLSFRFQLYGYKCFYNPAIVCYHKRGETVKRFKGWETMYTEKNLLALRIKNYPLSLYLSYLPLFTVARLKRYYHFIFKVRNKIIVSAYKGYLKGLMEIPKSLKKRRIIQKNKKVSNQYIKSLFVK